MAWDLEEQLGVTFAICSYPEALKKTWEAQRLRKRLGQKRSNMQFIDFHQLNKSLRDNISTNWSAWMMDVVKLAEQQQMEYAKERESLKKAYEDIINSILSEEMSITEAKTRVVMSADGVEVLDPEPDSDES